MAYRFANFSNVYGQSLSQSQKNRGDKDSFNKYGPYKLDKPASHINTKSIFTEDESQYFRATTNEDINNNDDIHQFIENSKTLREKIV